MPDWINEAKQVEPLNAAALARARARLAQQTRPQGSLGRLEPIIERLAAIQKSERLDLGKKRILIFAADHGVAEESVSAYPSEVTKSMVLNFLNGGATINALARHVDAEIQVIDAGVNADFEPAPGLISRKIARGTRNFTRGPAMSEREMNLAMQIGWDLALNAKSDGVRVLALGEMGIGNTTAASAMMAALTGKPAENVTGRGTGVDDQVLARKIEVIRRGLELHGDFFNSPLDILQRVGGFEIAALCGAILGAARCGIPAVIDGWIVSAAALSVIKLNPPILDYLFFAHESEERGHRILFDTIEAQPILNLSMRLGEASGAAMALGILEAAVRIYNEVATFEEAGVSRGH